MNTSVLAYSIAEFASRAGLSRQTVYNEINAGRLKTYKVGRRRFITPRAEQEWQELLEAQAEGAPRRRRAERWAELAAGA